MQAFPLHAAVLPQQAPAEQVQEQCYRQSTNTHQSPFYTKSFTAEKKNINKYRIPRSYFQLSVINKSLKVFSLAHQNPTQHHVSQH